jgi:hypothetical protein
LCRQHSRNSCADSVQPSLLHQSGPLLMRLEHAYNYWLSEMHADIVIYSMEPSNKMYFGRHAWLFNEAVDLQTAKTSQAFLISSLSYLGNHEIAELCLLNVLARWYGSHDYASKPWDSSQAKHCVSMHSFFEGGDRRCAPIFSPN